MILPRWSEVSRSRQITSNFAGYNHKISCPEGQYYEMQNITSDNFPVMSRRGRRKILHQFTKPQSVLSSGSDLYWVDNGVFYKNGEEKVSTASFPEGEFDMVKIGNKIIIDKSNLIVSADGDRVDHINRTDSFTGSLAIDQCDAFGQSIVYHDDAYYAENPPKNGDYILTKSGEKYVLKVYSETLLTWSTVASTFFKMTFPTSIMGDFKVGDGVKITVTDSLNQWEYGTKYLFPNGSTDTVLKSVGSNYIIIGGVIDGNHAFESDMTVTVSRTKQDMPYIVECNNRLWGCSTDGHEIYASKLGDPTNWSVFQGIASDSWAVTIGNDGDFTGAISLNGSPIFFKEDCIIKIIVSPTGGHQTKELRFNGVQKGSEKSLCEKNGTLFYKSVDGVYSYNGSVPIKISDALGADIYHDAVGGIWNNKYYISMKDNENKRHLFVFDIQSQIWCKEDDADAMVFSYYDGELLFVDRKDNRLKSICNAPALFPTATEEEEFGWMVESAEIGYSLPDAKYVSKLSICLSLSIGSDVQFFISYDDGEYEHKFSLTGTNTRTYTIPIIPRRCKVFRYRIVGNGNANIYSISKTVEEGSDIR